jgi:dTMP kinase
MDLRSEVGLSGQPVAGEQLEGELGRTDIMDFHHRVHQGYKELAQKEPQRWLTLDARLSPPQVARLIWQRVEPLVREMGPAKKAP